jgi:hypothetical protein
MLRWDDVKGRGGGDALQVSYARALRHAKTAQPQGEWPARRHLSCGMVSGIFDHLPASS